MAEPDESMKGRVCMVTGATSSIGEVTARELAKMGARVIVVGRNQGKSAATVDMIRRYSGNQDVEFMLADLSSQGKSAGWCISSKGAIRICMCW